MNLNYKGLMNILGLQKWIDRLTTLETTVANLPTPTPDGNGIYSSSDIIPIGTYASIIEDQSGNSMEFLLGNFPNAPEMNQNATETGFYYGRGFWGGVGMLYSNNNEQTRITTSQNLFRIESKQFTSGNEYTIRGGQGVPGVITSTKISGVTFSTIVNNNSFELNNGSANVQFFIGAGNPNGAVTGSPGDVYFNTSGGANVTMYLKESGANTNTGWVGK